jgi:Cdc25 family phosphatase
MEQGSGVGEVLKKNQEDKVGVEKDKDEAWEDVDGEGEGEKREQKVYVLDQGFVGWQERFGEDTRLTEGYRKEIWKDGY